MNLVDKRMSLYATCLALTSRPEGGFGSPLSPKWEEEFKEKWEELLETEGALGDQTQRLARQRAHRQLAHQHIVSVWFNAWQYTGSTDIWAGLVVEVTRKIEECLPMAKRLAIQWRYNLRTRPKVRPFPAYAFLQMLFIPVSTLTMHICLHPWCTLRNITSSGCFSHSMSPALKRA